MNSIIVKEDKKEVEPVMVGMTKAALVRKKLAFDIMESPC